MTQVIHTGKWRAFRRGVGVTATMTCPGCGHDFLLGHQHMVDPQGVVSPEVRCPWPRGNGHLRHRMDTDKRGDCDFIGEVRLDGWPPAAEDVAPAPSHHRVPPC